MDAAVDLNNLPDTRPIGRAAKGIAMGSRATPEWLRDCGDAGVCPPHEAGTRWIRL